MTSQENEKHSGAASNQQYGGACPHPEHGTSKLQVQKNSIIAKYRGIESWRGRKDGRVQEGRGNRAGQTARVAPLRNNESGRAERGGDQVNGADKDSQRASKKNEVGRAEWASISSHFSSIALALIDEAVLQLTEEHATTSRLQNG